METAIRTAGLLAAGLLAAVPVASPVSVACRILLIVAKKCRIPDSSNARGAKYNTWLKSLLAQLRNIPAILMANGFLRADVY
jgi:hypothetical protein